MQPVRDGLQVGFVPPGETEATPTDTVKVRSICAVSTTECGDHSRMRSASLAASAAQVSGNRMASSSPPKRAAVSMLRICDFDTLCDLFERDVAREMAVAVVDALEAVDVDHQAGDGAGPPLRAGQLLLQALLQVAAVVPPVRKSVMPARSSRARLTAFSMQTAATAPRCDQKVGSVMAREARRVAAAEAQRAGGKILAGQRHQGGAFQIRDARKKQMMVRADEGAEPWLVQGGELRRQADQRIDEENLLELLGPVAAGHEQMADLVLRIEEHDAHGIQRVGFASDPRPGHAAAAADRPRAATKARATGCASISVRCWPPRRSVPSAAS